MLELFRVNGPSVTVFLELLRTEGFEARDDLFRGQRGVLVGPGGLDSQRMPPHAAALFFPLWELNDPANRAALDARDFHGIL